MTFKAKKEEIQALFIDLQKFISEHINGQIENERATYPNSFWKTLMEDATARAHKFDALHKPEFVTSFYLAAYEVIEKRAQERDADQIVRFQDRPEYAVFRDIYHEVLKFEADERNPAYDESIWDDWSNASKKLRAQHPLAITAACTMAYTKAMAEEAVL